MSPRNLMSAYLFSLRPCGKMNESIMSSSFVTTPNTMMWTGCLIFINMNMNLFSDRHTNTMKSLYWCFWHECQAVQQEEWIVSRCCFLHKQCPTDLSLLHNRLNLKQIKQMSKINNLKCWQFTHHALYKHIYHHQIMLLAWISLTLSLSLSLFIRPYHPLLPVGPLDCILCPHRAVNF